MVTRHVKYNNSFHMKHESSTHYIKLVRFIPVNLAIALLCAKSESEKLSSSMS